MPEFQYLGGESGKGRLESALRNPAHTFGGRFVYRTVHDKAAILLWSIINNHPFVDGNKRMGLIAAHVFMILNGQLLFASRQDAIEICLRVAGAGSPVDLGEVKSWLIRNSIPVWRLREMSDGAFINFVESIGPFPDLAARAKNADDIVSYFRDQISQI